LSKTALTASAISDYLEMEQRWLALGRSYEFAERLSNFTEPFRNRNQSRNKPPQLATSFTRERPPAVPDRRQRRLRDSRWPRINDCFSCCLAV
jgi:hypothetical protein